MSPSRLLKQRVSIIGAGVAGLITAHGLARAGFRHIRIFDGAPNFESSAPSLHAGGVVLAGNGARILNQYGLLSKVAPYAQLIDNVQVRTHLNHPIHSYSPSELTRANSGSITLKDLGSTARSLFAASPSVTSIGVHGRILHEVLFKSLPKEVEVEWNARVRNITKTKEELEDPPVNLHFNNQNGNDNHQSQEVDSSSTLSSSEEAIDPDARLLESDIVIGADGLHSSLRYLVPQMANHPSPLEGSYIRGIVRLESEVRDAEGRSLQSRSNELVEIWGTGMKLAYYFIDTNTICWIATVHPSYGSVANKIK